MKIINLRINHYKSIKDPIIINNFSYLHILVGPNNAGKTNVLDAIQTVFDNNTDPQRFSDKDIDIELTVNVNNNDYKIIKNSNGTICNEEKILASVRSSFIRIGDLSSIYSLLPEKLKNFKENHPIEYDNFSKALKRYFKDVEISEELFLLSVYADNKKRSVRRMGEGFKRLFVILFYIFHPDYKIILIDEPELHLHPSIIKKFLLLIREKHLENQIFITTHHPTFVQADHLDNIWRVARNTNQSTAVYRFSGKNINVNRLIQEINDDNSGMLFSDKVLLVEGVSDKIFMTEMINRFYEKEKDIKVVYTGGKGTIDLYANICELFNIPYAVMLDSDAIKSVSLMRIKKYPHHIKGMSLREKLKQREIFILGRDLEHTYPKNYNIKETKPLSALFISKKITKDDLRSKRMETIKEILERI